jgi:hypothetical protein
LNQDEERILVIHVNLTRRVIVPLAVGLVAAALVAYLAWGQGEVAADSPQAPSAPSASMRQFYLSGAAVPDATHALTACAPGYHMASLWEILDPSNLRYNTILGATAPDGGQGPPVWLATDYHGWVRTGNIASTLDIAGLANCEVWTSDDGDHWGTTATLPTYWGVDMEDLHVWDVSKWPCSASLRVWCVED